MTLTGKLLTLGAGGAVVAGGATTAIYLTENKGALISDLLKEDDHVLLTDDLSNNEQWAARWKDYISSGENKWGLDDYEEKSKIKTVAPESFKNACKINLQKRVTSTKETIYIQVKEFCTKSFDIASLLAAEGLEVVKEAKGNSKWNEPWGKYFDNVKDKNPLQLKNLTSPKRATVPDDYKEKCDEENKKEVRNKKDEKYLTVKTYCATTKG